jgi:thiamine biosynthesis protein ThiS
MIRLRVNGRDLELAGPTPLLDYLAGLGVDPRGVAVELNERILERSEYGDALLGEGDAVEIVKMVGGGRGGGPSPPGSTPGSPPRPRRARPRARARRR